MHIIMAPAKTFRKIEEEKMLPYKPLKFSKETMTLIEKLQSYEIEMLQEKMKISNEVALVNKERYKAFKTKEHRGYYAADFYYGEVFKAWDTMNLSEEARHYMQASVTILSGLYGSVSPMDVIAAYRLEMAFKLVDEKPLVRFWKEQLTSDLLEKMALTSGNRVLINLASEEYSKAVDLKAIRKKYKVITISFKEFKNGKYKVVGMYAKRARGLMLRYLCENKVQDVEAMKNFREDGYQYDEMISNEEEWIFVKK